MLPITNATNQPKNIKFTKGGQTKQQVGYNYQDATGLLSEVNVNGKNINYYYENNNLLREDNRLLNVSQGRSYYGNGNISTYTKGAYQTNNGGNVSGTTTSYTYSGDRMMSYGNQACEYDNMGNPTTYRGKSATWKGRQMLSYDGVNFCYDGRGRRISKNNITFFHDSNGRLIKQYNNTPNNINSPYTLIFYYDFEGVTAFKYTDKNNNDMLFFYQKDAQGNIIAIVDSTGSVVVQYYYDAWGNHKVVDANGDEITDQDDIGNVNPFRYRGYYYDTETGLYFLQTRYYDPEVGRFLNRDSVQYADPETINGLNLYAYCLNNPIEYTDPYGTTEWWEWLLGGVIVFGLAVGSMLTGGAVAAAFAGATIGAGISLGTQAVSGELNWGQFALDIGVGALTGAIGASGLSRATATVLGGLIGSGSSIASDLINGKSINIEKAVISGLIGIAAGYVGGAGVRDARGLSSAIYNKFSNNLTAGITSFVKNSTISYLLPLQHSLFRTAMVVYAGSTIASNIISGIFF